MEYWRTLKNSVRENDSINGHSEFYIWDWRTNGPRNHLMFKEIMDLWLMEMTDFMQTALFKANAGHLRSMRCGHQTFDTQPGFYFTQNLSFLWVTQWRENRQFAELIHVQFLSQIALIETRTSQDCGSYSDVRVIEIMTGRACPEFAMFELSIGSIYRLQAKFRRHFVGCLRET